MGRRRQPPRLRPGLLVARLFQAGLALHHPPRRGLVLQRRRTRRQARQTTSSHLRLLADRPDPQPLVSDPVLPHLGPQPWPDRPGRHHPRTGRETLATRTSGSVTASITLTNP